MDFEDWVGLGWVGWLFVYLSNLLGLFIYAILSTIP